jgi:hypothetical protein
VEESMFGFKQYIPFLTEQKAPARGIQHLPHAFEPTLHANRGGVNKAISSIQGVISGRTPMTRKIDDRMSFQAIRTPEGKVGVKYKGPGAKYNFSHEDIKTQYSEKPYIAGPMMNLLNHVYKVLPKGGGALLKPELRKMERYPILRTLSNTLSIRTHLKARDSQNLD